MRAPPAHFDPVCGLRSNEINPRATFVSSKFRWSLQSTAVVAHHASLFPTDSPAAAGPAATPGHLGSQRPQRRPRNGGCVPAPECSPCTRRHLEPAHITRQCAALPIILPGELPMPTPLHVTSASWNQPSLRPSTGLAPTCPLYLETSLAGTFVGCADPTPRRPPGKGNGG